MTPRHLGIDLLKVVCAQLIVWHHAVNYAPASLAWARQWPALAEFLLEPGRWVVHVFLVVGGYLSAQALERNTRDGFVTLVWRRYWRLMPLFVLAMAVTVLMAWGVRRHYAPDFITSSIGLSTWLAHLTLSFDWLDIDAISAGAWYVAIDFQLYVLLVMVVLAHRRGPLIRRPWVRPTLMTLGVLVSALILSRLPHWDAWPVYFLCSYGLGVLVCWAQSCQISRHHLWHVLAILAIDLMLSWRGRQALALSTTLILMAWPLWQSRLQSPGWLARANDLSYALFVGHFSLIIGLGAWWQMHAPATPWAALEYLAVVSVLAWVWAWAFDRFQAHSAAWAARHLGARPRWA